MSTATATEGLTKLESMEQFEELVRRRATSPATADDVEGFIETLLEVEDGSLSESAWNRMNANQRAYLERRVKDAGRELRVVPHLGESIRVAFKPEELSAPVPIQAYYPQGFTVNFYPDNRVAHAHDVDIHIVNANSQEEANQKAFEFLMSLRSLPIPTIVVEGGAA